MNERRVIVAGIVLAGLLAACGGGSGSTGLITPEQALIDDVRQTGTCGELDGTPYCATDSPNAGAPGGQRASVLTPVPSPQPTSTAGETPGAGAPTATPAAGRRHHPRPLEVISRRRQRSRHPARRAP